MNCICSYLKRGVNDWGRVANDAETEQIVLDEEVWLLQGKNEFELCKCATKLHFEDLANRYDNPIIVLNLIKIVEKRPREIMLRREFANDVGYLNQILPVENHLRFIPWDFHKFAKTFTRSFSPILEGYRLHHLCTEVVAELIS
ncbi:unnamed protein product [Sphenostylis stenocarpa]|uniref:SAC domain-containing protein n=1 Tax=Sphenostylis stenocarpa TaxID=92480 RepID=A0AA86W5C9_9FABA|nr:unnamed protein product [Sphenostylis stenocarpa]